MYSLISFLLIGIYVVLILWVCAQWKIQKTRKIDKGFLAETFISVIVPVRNEEDYIIACIQSILQNDYPANLFELIVVDDHSDDNTLSLIKVLNHPNLKILELKDSDDRSRFKKAALKYAIGKANGDLILCTDGDSIVSREWLKHHAYGYQLEGALFQTGPVMFHEEKSLLARFQSLDMLGLMAITNAGISTKRFFMANGANMSFDKRIFQEINGFEEADKWASGDDMFLIEKFRQRDDKSIHFIKSARASIRTKVQENLSGYLSQRKRWATKSSAYAFSQLNVLMIFVSLLCANIVLAAFLTSWKVFFISVFLKVIVDYYFLMTMTKYFDRKDLNASYFPSIPMHIGHILYSAWCAVFPSKYSWKGRKIT